MSYKENAHANKLCHHGYSQKKKMKISIRMVLVLQWVLAICALSSRDWLPPGYQWCQVRPIPLNKVGRIFPRVISSDFRIEYHRDDDHREGAPQFRPFKMTE